MSGKFEKEIIVWLDVKGRGRPTLANIWQMLENEYPGLAYLHLRFVSSRKVGNPQINRCLTASSEVFLFLPARTYKTFSM